MIGDPRRSPRRDSDSDAGKDYTRALTAAELEMMSLTGGGTGLDMVTMPLAMREQVPTSNFFQRSGNERPGHDLSPART
jgi:hypothetical protein